MSVNSMAEAITFRPEQSEDLPFLQRLYASTRAEELKQVPWSDPQRDAFLKMQLHLQTTHFRRHYPEASYQIVLVGDRPIGRLYVHRAEDHILLLDIALLPENRGAGIGGRLLEELLLEATVAQKPVRIHVEQQNPALRLYTRLGFRILDQSGIYYFMEWCSASKLEESAKRVQQPPDSETQHSR